ncbi:hypothetical protein Hypma_004724 [Hypsizygus marmoreus]|uniref:Uncharacterized protein n=1 Tax=Hypsizygus marmoreus TaxID=39966 RepID=A0A369IZQ7_HYPMA|nr:hypothetical protein Hypma_004724 [Hypsizygus marmoreus]
MLVGVNTPHARSHCLAHRYVMQDERRRWSDREDGIYHVYIQAIPHDVLFCTHSHNAIHFRCHVGASRSRALHRNVSVWNGDRSDIPVLQGLRRGPPASKTSCGIFSIFLVINAEILFRLLELTEFTHQISIGHAMYWFTIKVFDVTSQSSVQYPQSLVAIVELSAVASLLVTGFFVHRLWKSTKNAPHIVFLAILAMAEFVLHCLIGLFLRRSPSVDELIVHYRPLLITCWACGVTSDVLLTAALCYDLYLRRPSTMYRTAKIVDRLMMWCVGEYQVTTKSFYVLLVLCGSYGDGYEYFGGGNGYLRTLFINRPLDVIERKDSEVLHYVQPLNHRRTLRRICGSEMLNMAPHISSSHEQTDMVFLNLLAMNFTTHPCIAAKSPHQYSRRCCQRNPKAYSSRRQLCLLKSHSFRPCPQ